MPHQDQQNVDITDARVVIPVDPVPEGELFDLIVDADFVNHSNQPITGVEWGLVINGEVLGDIAAPDLGPGESKTARFRALGFDTSRFSGISGPGEVTVDVRATGTGHTLRAGTFRIGQQDQPPSNGSGDDSAAGLSQTELLLAGGAVVGAGALVWALTRDGQPRSRQRR